MTSLRASLEDARRALDALMSDAGAVAAIDAAADLLAARLRAGGKVLICGNGGSLCDAAHFAEEMTGRFRADRPALAAIACADPGHLTCVANDYGFDRVFARWVEALARPEDVLILLSTSGMSANLVAAAKAARSRSVPVFALLGRGGGDLLALCEYGLVVPGGTSDRIQELHMLILHAWVEGIEARLFPRPASDQTG